MAMKFKHGSELLSAMTKDGGSEGRKPVIRRGSEKPDLPALSQQTTVGEVSASPTVAASTYYKRPDFGSRSQKLYDDAMTAESSMKEKQTAWETASNNLTQAEEELSVWSQQLQMLRDIYGKAPTPENGELVTWTEGEMDRVLMDFAKVQESYDSAYSGYETQYQQYAAAVDAYNSYIQDQQTQYDAWKGTIRDEETIRGDIEAVEAQMNSLRRSGTGGRWNDASLTQMQSLTDAKALLEEELSWSQYFHYAGFAEASDFKEKSQYVSTANGVKRSAGEIMMGIYTDAGSGWDDPLYEYINGNQEAGIYISNQAATKYGVGNAIGEAFGRLTESRSEARQMTENEIATFNYIYATEGKEAAHQYYNYLLADLNYRQRQQEEQTWGAYAADHKLGASVLSVAMSPAKGLSYLGQAVDYLEDGKIDQNAAYNKISYIPSAIRAKVSENWGAVGSFAYQTGMSMADFLLNTAITGGSEAASLAIMGTGAAADATISAKDRGLSDNQAFALGTIAGIAEVITEKVSLETLLNPDLLAEGTLKYILKNALAEGSEEVGSDLINLVADILVSRDQSQWQQSIDAYVADGKTEQEAFGLAVAEQAAALGLDFLGGAISGGVMGSAGAAVMNRNTQRIGTELENLNLSDEDIQSFIETGLESDPGTASHKLAEEMQKKLEAGKKLSGTDLSRLYQANVQAVAEEQEAEAPKERNLNSTTGLEWAGSEPATETEKEAQSQTAGNVEGKERNGDSVNISVAEQLRREAAEQGGNIHESETGLRLGAAFEQPEAGNNVPDGGGQRAAGAGTGKQAGTVAAGTEGSRQQAEVDRRRATVARQNRAGHLQKVSSLDLGITTGTEAKSIRVMPREIWDEEMTGLADRIYEETKKDVTFVVGRIQIRGSDGNVKVRGLYTGEQIFVQVDNGEATMEQIADHEAYHAKVDFAGNARLNDRIREHILERFSEEEFAAVLDKYIAALRGIYNLDEAKNEAEYDAMMRRIEEELFADAYAGINAFGAGADQFTGAVNEKMTELYLGKQTRQENGTRQTNGPNGERYSYAGEIEARDVAGRRNLTAEQRKKTPPISGGEDTLFAESSGESRDSFRYSVDDTRELSDVEQKAVDIFGVTTAFEEAGYILTDGRLLRMTDDWHQGERIYDHRAIAMAYGADVDLNTNHGFSFENGHYLDEFVEAGNIRFDAGEPDLDMDIGLQMSRSVPLTKAQENTIRDLVEWKENREEEFEAQLTEDSFLYSGPLAIRLDFGGDSHYAVGSASAKDLAAWGKKALEYQGKRINASQIIHDIRRYYETGETAQRSNLNQFRYSVDEEAQQKQADGAKKVKPARGDSYTVFMEDSDELSLQMGDRYSADDVDSHGHSLTPEQQEFYAQSQARDSSGRLLVLYHQTDGDFTIFDTRHPGAGSRDSDTPFGIFLKQTAGDIGLAGKKQMALYANITNPLRAANREDLARQLREISGSYATISDKHKQLDAQYHEKFEQAKKAWRDYIIEWRAANPGANRSALNDDPKFNELFDAEDAVVDEWTAAADLLSTQAKEAITEDLRKAGYDGVFLENDVGSWGRRTDAIIALDPQQVKNISNKTPTSNPDIRYSVDDGGQDSAQQQPAAPKKKIRPVAESRPITAKRQLKSTLYNMFSIPAGERTELGEMIDSYADRLIKNRSLTEEDRKAFFDRMYESGVMTVPANPYYAEARNYLKEGRIYISDSLVADLGDDWNETRRRAFAAGIYLTRSREQNGHSSMGIDVWNADLAEELPGLFDSEETDERSILERIIQVAEEGKDEKLSLAEYTAHLADKDYVSEDEFLNNMERQLDWALRTFAEKADLEINLRDRTGRKIAEERAKGNERLTRQRAREIQRQAEERQARREAAQRAKERRELRELQQKTLKQLRWLNKNRNRAPEELRDAWDEVLGDIDLYAVSAANEMNWSEKHSATWRDLAQMYKDAQENDPNFLPSKELEKIVGRLNSGKIGDMDPGALQDLYKAAIGLRTEFYNRNNVVNDEMHRLFAEVYTDSKKEIESAPGGYTGNRVDQLFNLDQLTPMNVLQRMGGWDPDGTFYSMAKQLEKGERDMRAYTVKANRILADFLTDNADWVSKCDGQGKDGIWYEVEIPTLLALEVGKPPVFGETVKVWMTPAQKVHLYLESKNQDNLRHMTGGRTFVNKDLYSQGKRQEALSQGTTIRMAPETVKLLVSDLTAEEMELASLLDRYYNSYATGEINRVSNILYGYDKAMGSHYAPIYTNRNYTKSEFGVFDVTAEGVGNLKERQVSKNPSYNISALDAFERHMDQTARFVGMAIPARNWTNLMNWREKNNSAGDVITHKWGEVGKKYITDLITTLQSGGENQTDSVSEGANKLMSNYITAVFGANLSIVLKQLGSIPMAGAYLDMRNFPTYTQIKNIDRELIAKHTQDLEWRTMGYSMPETKYLKDNPNWTKKNKVYGFVFGGDAITAMDGWAASVLWPWAENKVSREHRELDAGSEAFYKKVAEEFEDALARSQSTSDEIHQSSLRKSKNPITKAFTMFRSDSAQTYNTIRQKIGELQYYARNGENEAAVKHARKAVGAAFGALLLNAVWSEAVSLLMALWKNKGKNYRDDEDELGVARSVISEMTTNMVYSMMGTVTFGEEIAEAIGSWITGGKWYDIEAPGLEQINEVVSVIGDAAGGLKDLISGASDIVKNDGDLGKYFRQHSGDILGHIKETAQTAATYFTGLSVNNVEAYLLGTVKWISPELGTAYDELFQSVGKNDLAGMTGDSLYGRIGRILDRRGISESDETAEALGQLYEAGFKGAIPGDTPSSVSVNGEQQKLSVYQQQAYDTIWSGTVGGLLDELVASEKFTGADAQVQEKMLKYLYTYASEMAKSELFDDYEPDTRDEAVQAYADVGLTMVDFLHTYGKYTEINSLYGNATTKATAFARWLDGQGYTSNQKAVIKDELSYYNMSPATSDKYDELVESGVDPDDAVELVEDIRNLQPEEGKDQVADAQKWRECVDRSSNHMVQMSYLYAFMTEDQYTKLGAAYTFGVDPEVFVAYYEVRAEYDTNGNGSYSNEEVQATIDSMTGYQLTAEQKAVLWQLMTGRKSAKNNPYSISEGQSLLDYLETE